MLRDGVIEPMKDGNLDPYIIFIANSDVYDFYITGDEVEYIVIKLDDDSYRLITNHSAKKINVKSLGANQLIVNFVCQYIVYK